MVFEIVNRDQQYISIFRILKSRFLNLRKSEFLPVLIETTRRSFQGENAYRLV